MILSAASQTRCESDEGSIAERFGDTVVRTAKPSPTTSPTSVVVSINAIATRGASISAAAEAAGAEPEKAAACLAVTHVKQVHALPTASDGREGRGQTARD